MAATQTIDTDEHEEIIEAALQLIVIVKARITDDSDIKRTSYNSAAEFRFYLDSLTYQVKLGNLDGFRGLNFAFSPTNDLQEHAMTNGWANEYMILAKRSDNLYAKLMSKL